MKSKSINSLMTLNMLALVFGISTLPMAQGSPQAQGEVTKSSPQAVIQQAIPKERTAVPKSDQGKTASPLSHKVIAYYFYGNFRCSSCQKIEDFTKEAIQGKGGFADPLKSGRLEWRVIKVEKPGNEHFIKDFQLDTKSFVIVDIREGKQKQWKNLAKVWELLYDKDAFVKYVRDEIDAYLAGRP